MALAMTVVPAGARVASAQVVIDEETTSVSQCGLGLLQTSCVAVSLRFQSVCQGLCTSGIFSILLKDAQLIGATDLPLGGNADFRVERCFYMGTVVSPMCHPIALTPPVGGACTWPALLGPQSCEVVDSDVVFVGEAFVGPQLRVTAQASSLLSGVSAQDDVGILVNELGQLSFF